MDTEGTTNSNETKYGLKDDKNKQPWYSLPLVILKPLAAVYEAGESKYEIFNCLQPFEDSDRRFWDATMRHLELCQINPLAIDKELLEKYNKKVYHGAQVCFNMLHRINEAERRLHEK